jgi:phosphomevalonate kinase
MIEWAAPGKAVIWGEYAVLAGAPALVMAVDRYARAAVTPGGGVWHIVSRGFESEGTLTAGELAGIEPGDGSGAVQVIRAALAALDDPPLPAGAEVRTDTTRFHERGEKLGIGSSAAVCSAACAALADALDRPFTPEVALRAHQLLQGRAGSGLDIAAACRGGLLRFQAGNAAECRWPRELHYRFFWAGHPASTTDHVARFNQWRASADTDTLDALCRAAEALFARTDLDRLQDYVACLKAMDGAAGLGIYGAAHARLDELASRAQVVYKPCGAGGGDIGIAVSDDASSLDSLTTLAARESFPSLTLEIAAHGVHRISS